MIPTIGCIVHFRPALPNGKDFYPAIITHVWSDTVVNLAVFDDGSFRLPGGAWNTFMTSVKLADEDADESFSCWWPPRA